MFEKLIRSLSYVRQLLGFAFSVLPQFWLSLFLIVLAPFVELVAMSSLLPLSQLVMGGSSPQGAVWQRLFLFFDIPMTFSYLLLVFLVLFLCQLILNFAGLGLSVYLGKKLQAHISSTAFRNILKLLPIQEIEARSMGFFMRLAGEEASNAGAIVSISFQLVGVLLLAVLYLAAIFSYSFPSGLAVIVFLFLALVFMSGAFRKSHQLGRRQIQESRDSGSFFIDALNGLRSVKSFLSEEYVSDKYRTLIFKYADTLFRIDLISLMSRLGPVFILFAFAIGWVLLGSAHLDFSPELGAFVFTILVYLMRFFPTVGRALNMSLKVISDASMGTDVVQIVTRQAVPEAVQKQRLVGAVEEIEVRNLSFGHSKNSLVLEKFGTRFQRGKSYAIVGESGAGKSTLLDLILCFYTDFSGEITINGIDVRRLESEDIRSRILLTGQSMAIYNDTIMENITYGRSTSLDQVRRAAKLACIDDFIQALPDKYQTKLQYQGSNLSGGQRQRIAIARALLRSPSVLILDESTSALDVETRAQVVENLMSEYKDKILIFVTHDQELSREVSEVIRLSAQNLANRA